MNLGLFFILMEENANAEEGDVGEGDEESVLHFGSEVHGEVVDDDGVDGAEEFDGEKCERDGEGGKEKIAREDFVFSSEGLRGGGKHEVDEEGDDHDGDSDKPWIPGPPSVPDFFGPNGTSGDVDEGEDEANFDGNVGDAGKVALVFDEMEKRSKGGEKEESHAKPTGGNMGIEDFLDGTHYFFDRGVEEDEEEIGDAGKNEEAINDFEGDFRYFHVRLSKVVQRE